MAEGVRRVGASKASLISTLGPPATAVMAQEFTGEILAPAQWLGIALVLIGVMALEVRRRVHLKAASSSLGVGISVKCPYN